MTGDLLLALPSRNRPESVARFLQAVHKTSKMKTHVCVGVDDDDPRFTEYLDVMERYGGEDDQLESGPRKGLVAWTNEIASKRVEDYPYLASFGDDHIPSTPGWDKALIKAIERMGGTGVVYPWDGTREDIPEACVLSSNIVQKLGWMSMPDLEHWYQDNVWADLGRGIGRLRHLRAIKVEHAWKEDQTSRDSAEKLTADRDAYYLWRKERMADDIKMLFELIEGDSEPVTTIAS